MSDAHGTQSVADELAKLTELWNSGAITQKEFEEAKRQVLGIPGTRAAATVPGRSDPADAPSHIVVPRPASPDTPFSPLLGNGEQPGDVGLPNLPVDGVKLGNLQGRDDPPPIPESAQPPPMELDPDWDPDVVPVPPPPIKRHKIAVDPHADAEPTSAAHDGPGADPEERVAPTPMVVGYAAPGVKPGVAWRYVPWFLIVGLISALALWTTLLPSHRPIVGVLLVVCGVALTVTAGVWLLVAASRVSTLWFMLVLFAALVFPLANLIFILMHWRHARGPFFTTLVGVILLLGGLVVGLGTLDKKAAAVLDPGRARSNIRLSPPRAPSHAIIQRSVRWRPGDKFSCQAFQHRLDDCEPVWISHLEGEVRTKGMGVGTARIAVMMPRVAVDQAQSLVFERGGLHRCQVAIQRKTLIEQTWLQKTKACMMRRGCKRFSACHVSVFLQYVGRIPFHCRAYCNREVFHCGRFLARRSLSKEQGRDVPLTSAVYTKMRPRFHRSCLERCAKRTRPASTREKLHECIFQRDCREFAKCVDAVPEAK